MTLSRFLDIHVSSTKILAMQKTSNCSAIWGRDYSEQPRIAKKLTKATFCCCVSWRYRCIIWCGSIQTSRRVGPEFSSSAHLQGKTRALGRRRTRVKAAHAYQYQHAKITWKTTTLWVLNITKQKQLTLHLRWDAVVQNFFYFCFSSCFSFDVVTVCVHMCCFGVIINK